MNRQTDARAPRVKNRAPAAIQITAEQLLREVGSNWRTLYSELSQLLTHRLKNDKRRNSELPNKMWQIMRN
jgi:hypothetical protein